jgi:hypothetical protein
MAATRSRPPASIVTYPNRSRAASRATRAVVVALLIASTGLMLAVTIGGWSKLEGMIPVGFAWCVAYLLIAFYLATRWARGLLPIAAGLGILLLLISLAAGVGAAGQSWFDRSQPGYAAATSLFGGAGLSPDTLGILTLAIAPVQALLIVIALRAFSQNWNVEVEVPVPAGDESPAS